MRAGGISRAARRVSSWAGETDINSCSIGIEIVNPGHEFGYPDFPLRQIAAVISLCKTIITRRGPISADRILAHSDAAPARTGSGREISRPAERIGIGHWVRPVGQSRRPVAPAGCAGRRGDPAAACAARLRLRHRRNRHLRRGHVPGPHRVPAPFPAGAVDGIADSSTLLTLRAPPGNRDRAPHLGRGEKTASFWAPLPTSALGQERTEALAFHHPPRAIATPVKAPPMNTMTRPARHSSPVQRPNA